MNGCGLRLDDNRALVGVELDFFSAIGREFPPRALEVVVLNHSFENTHAYVVDCVEEAEGGMGILRLTRQMQIGKLRKAQRLQTAGST